MDHINIIIKVPIKLTGLDFCVNSVSMLKTNPVYTTIKTQFFLSKYFVPVLRAFLKRIASQSWPCVSHASPRLLPAVRKPQTSARQISTQSCQQLSTSCFVKLQSLRSPEPARIRRRGEAPLPFPEIAPLDGNLPG